MIYNHDNQHGTPLVFEAEEDLWYHHSILTGIKTNREPQIEFGL